MEWAGYVLLASGAMCMSTAWFGRFPVDLKTLPEWAAFVGLVAIVTGFGCIYISRRDKGKDPE